MFVYGGNLHVLGRRMVEDAIDLHTVIDDEVYRDWKLAVASEDLSILALTAFRFAQQDVNIVGAAGVVHNMQRIAEILDHLSNCTIHTPFPHKCIGLLPPTMGLKRCVVRALSELYKI